MDNLECSPYLEPIPQEARDVAEAFLDDSENADVIFLLRDLDSASAVEPHIVTLLGRATSYFEEKNINRQVRAQALTSALVSRWAKLHPLDKHQQ